MRKKIVRTCCLLAAMASLSASLSGCIVGDGIAHVVKLAQENRQTASATPAAQSTPAPAAQPQDVAPPPPPAAAPERSSVSVETLK